MSQDTTPKAQNSSASNPAESLQPVIYGVLPDQPGDEINLGDLFSKLIAQWKLILAITASGTLLAVVVALILPNVYRPAITVSIPLSGDIASVTTIYTLLVGSGSGSELPATPQGIFNEYFGLLRSGSILTDYIHEKNYLNKLYPDDEKPESVLLAKLLEGWNVEIEEPAPEEKGAHIASPKRVKAGIDVEYEEIGVDLLNGYSSYVNQKLITNLQDDVHKTIKNKIEVLSKTIASQREQYRLDRVLTIKKMEQDNAKEIAVLEEQVLAYLKKAEANRATRIANAKEALDMAKSLNITYPTTLAALAEKSQKGKSANTAITVLDKQSSSLYLKGSKYLTTLIETLENRKSDEKYLAEINNLRERVYLIKNDQVLAALKKRESDDPWIKDLPEKLAKIDALKKLNPDFASLVAYSTDQSAMITDKKVKPKRALIVIIAFLLSMMIAVFVAMVVGARKER